MFNIQVKTRNNPLLLAGIVASGIFAYMAQAQIESPQASGVAKTPAVPANPIGSSGRSRAGHLPTRAGLYYAGFWGVDSLGLKIVESGEIVRFTWRVVDPSKAAPLHDKKFEPALIDAQAGVKLVVPSLEQVGQLRQTGTPKAGNSYWMAFSNKGRLVKRGDLVSVLIGQFRADGLIVE